MEIAASESESLLGADDTALVPEEKCVCMVEGKEEERRCIRKPPMGFLFGCVDGRLLLGMMLLSFTLETVFYLSIRKVGLGEVVKCCSTPSFKCAGKKRKWNAKGKKSTKLKSWVKSPRSTQLNFWNKTCSIQSFQQAILKSTHPPLFRKKKKKNTKNPQV